VRLACGAFYAVVVLGSIFDFFTISTDMGSYRGSDVDGFRG
jgi:hypothetical protein